MFKRLFVNGDSFSMGWGLTDKSLPSDIQFEQMFGKAWPMEVSKHTGLPLVNLSSGAVSNDRISRTTLEWIEKYKPTDTLFLIGVTDVSRVELPVKLDNEEYYTKFSNNDRPRYYNNLEHPCITSLSEYKVAFECFQNKKPFLCEETHSGIEELQRLFFDVCFNLNYYSVRAVDGMGAMSSVILNGNGNSVLFFRTFGDIHPDFFDRLTLYPELLNNTLYGGVSMQEKLTEYDDVYLDDGTHPNENGTQIIANIFVREYETRY